MKWIILLYIRYLCLAVLFHYLEIEVFHSLKWKILIEIDCV